MEIHTVRVGVKSARELEIEVEDPASVMTAFERVLKGKDTILWITDVQGNRFGVTADSVAFIEVEKPKNREVGFGG